MRTVRVSDLKRFRDSHFAVVTQLVEYDLAKVDVAGSSPVYCSRDSLNFGGDLRYPAGALKTSDPDAVIEDSDTKTFGRVYGSIV
jgi:hypothetical protein